MKNRPSNSNSSTSSRAFPFPLHHMLQRVLLVPVGVLVLALSVSSSVQAQASDVLQVAIHSKLRAAVTTTTIVTKDLLTIESHQQRQRQQHRSLQDNVDTTNDNTNDTTNSNDINKTTTTTRDEIEIQEAPNLTGIYNLPSFAFRFESPNRLNTNVNTNVNVNANANTEKNAGDVIASTVYSPLKLVTEEFLLESFADDLALDKTGTIPDMVFQILSVSVQVTVWHEYSDNQEKNARHLSDSVTLTLPHLSDRDLQTGSNSNKSKMIRFYAEFVGTIAFVPPTATSTDVPTNEYIYTLMQKWMETSFRQDHEVLKTMLKESPVPAVNQLQDLQIFMDIDLDSLGQNPFVVLDNGAAINENSDDRGKKDKVLMSSLILLSCLTVVALALYVRRPVHRMYNLKQADGAFPSPDDHQNTRTLPGRHGDATDILEASDRYLSQHRPDLFQIMSRNGSHGGNNTKNNTNDNSNNNNSGNKFAQSLASMDGVEYDDDEEHEDYMNGDTSNNNTSLQDSTESVHWWTKLTSSLKHHAVLHAPHRFVENLVCDEDPGAYPFAFSDFPRHDGTPCLIYSESETGPATLMNRVTVSPMKDPPSLSQRTCLSDDEFQKALSQHDTSLDHHDEDDDDDDEDNIYGNHFRDHDDNDYYDNRDNDGTGDESIEVEFTNKLERLVAMRHRHYEKESIMEKHREIRRRERNQAEAYERQLRLRRHEMELDLSEIEATVTPLAQRHAKKAWLETPEHKNKMTHRTTSSNPDLLRSGNSTVFDELIADQQDAAVKSMTPVSLSTTNGYGPTTDSGCQHPADNTSSPVASIAGMPPKSPSPKVPIPPQVFHQEHMNANANANLSGGLDDPDQPLKPSRNKNHKRLSHRRSFSHGTIEEKEGENKSNGSNGNNNRHRRQESNEEALMTFGIAAYIV